MAHEVVIYRLSRFFTTRAQAEKERDKLKTMFTYIPTFEDEAQALPSFRPQGFFARP
jgi:hypothetical protein